MSVAAPAGSRLGHRGEAVSLGVPRSNVLKALCQITETVGIGIYIHEYPVSTDAIMSD